MLPYHRSNMISLLVIALFDVYVIYASLHLHMTESKIMPLSISLLLSVLLCIALVQEYRRRDEPEAEANPDAESPTLPQMLKNLLPLFILVGVVYLTGFIAGVWLFVAGYIRLYGRGTLFAIITASIVTCFVYGVFEVLLEIILYPGVIWENM